MQNKDMDQLGMRVTGQKGDRTKGVSHRTPYPLETEGIHNIESKIWYKICDITKHIYQKKFILVVFLIAEPNTEKMQARGEGGFVWTCGLKVQSIMVWGTCFLLSYNLREDRKQGWPVNYQGPLPGTHFFQGTCTSSDSTSWSGVVIKDRSLWRTSYIPTIKRTIEKMGDQMNKRIVQDVAKKNTSHTHIFQLT